MNKFGEKKSILTNILTQEELIYIFKVKLNLMFCPCQWQKCTARFICGAEVPRELTGPASAGQC